jgi:membrane fusion protein, type I secretion system
VTDAAEAARSLPPAGGAKRGLAGALAGLTGAGQPGPDLSRTIILGFSIIAIFIGGFGLWAATAPLRGAVVASGSVIVDSKRKTIQHLEGGIVREIDVRDGEKVKADQVLMRLDDTQASATLQQVTARYDSATALVARLTAEELGKSQIDFPPSLLARRDDPDVAKLIDGQTAIFKARLNELNSQTEILQKRDAQAADQIRGLEAQIAAERQQLALIAEEIKDKNYLLQKGLIPKPEVLQLQRQAAQIEGTMNQNITSIAQAKQSIAETQLRISELRTNRVNEASKEHGDALKDLFDNTERMRAARDVLKRTVLRAPLDGTVMELAVHTIGGVVSPGAALMEIVPSADRLEIEAKIPVNDIEHVRAGEPAQVRLVAYSQRDTPSLDGTVSWVSADRVDDQKAGNSYYTARIDVDREQLAALKQVKLYPGMPVEAMILGSKRTALDYLLGPVNRTFARGMREN